MKRASLTTLLLCAAAPLAAAQAPAQQSAASSATAQLEWFVGAGNCTATNQAMGTTPARTSTGKFRGELTLGGQWVVLHYTQDKTAAIPNPFAVDEYIGYDTAKKQFVSISLYNSSGMYETGTSAGRTGNTVTFDVPTQMDGKPVQSRDVFSIPESGVWTHTGMLRDDSGKWITTDKETCHRP